MALRPPWAWVGCAASDDLTNCEEVRDMADDKTILMYGALLHDIGKVVYRGKSERGTHSKLGANFLLNDIAPLNVSFDGDAGKRVAEQVRYHHAREIAEADGLANDSLAFITYFADNISAGMDRKIEGDESLGAAFDKSLKLRKIFNIINGNCDDNTVEHDDYNIIREDIRRGLAGLDIAPGEVNSLLNLLEATTSSVPSSTNTSEVADVSLYDHAKTTAGIAACIYDYLSSSHVTDFRTALFDAEKSRAYYSEPMFLLYSCDMSGIQDFIYNISGAGALKQLRARSLYLELLLEHVMDELLVKLNLSRANLLYTGGGHAYALLPNTAMAKAAITEFTKELDSWLMAHYRTDLFLAAAWVECSADDLMNAGEDKHRYPMLYRRLSRKLSARKSSRYSVDVLKKLNFAPVDQREHDRECTECHRSDLHVDADGKCPLCASLGAVSRELVMKDVFAIRQSDSEFVAKKGELPLPFGKTLSMYGRDEYLAQAPSTVRVYTKNSWDTGIGLATHIWMGDYQADTAGRGVSAYEAQSATLAEGLGVKRLGVLRADVDNLGTVFVSGIPLDKVSISRTSTLSRALSYFFKAKVNKILQAGDYRLQVIYSGGDDLFIVGNWSDVIHAAVDIRQALDEYTGNGSLTISAGIGMFDSAYPIANMAAETGELEDAAKGYAPRKGETPRKNAVALWSKDRVFRWDEFICHVLPRKEEVARAFDANEKGKAFIYKLVHLLRAAGDEPISIPRLAYLLARSFEDDKANGAETSRKFYGWALDETERRYLLAALEWYVYETREKG